MCCDTIVFISICQTTSFGDVEGPLIACVKVRGGAGSIIDELSIVALSALIDERTLQDGSPCGGVVGGGRVDGLDYCLGGVTSVVIVTGMDRPRVGDDLTLSDATLVRTVKCVILTLVE